MSPTHPSGGPRDLRYYVGGEALIVGDWKLVVGVQHDSSFSRDSNVSCDALKPPSVGGSWESNSTPGVPCTCGVAGCLYHLKNDPNELSNQVEAQPQVAAQLHSRLAELRESVYAPDRGTIEQAACDVVDSRYHGFWGPWRDL